MTKDNEELYTALQTQMDDLKDTVHRIESKTDQICTLATNVEIVKTNMKHLQLAQDDLYGRCDEIDEKVDKMHDEPYDNFKQKKNQIISTIIGRLLGDLGSAIGGALIALIASGKIHF